jgi:DNA cross-link repair 1A protein
MATPMPLLGKSKTTSKKIATPVAAQRKGKGNGNIMSFFKKAESSTTSLTNTMVENGEEGLFLEESPVKKGAILPLQTPTPPRDETTPEDVEMEAANSPLSRYNEDAIPNKRRRTEASLSPTPDLVVESREQTIQRGPFADDSDSDEEEVKAPVLADSGETLERDTSKSRSPTADPLTTIIPLEKDPFAPTVPSLKREPTSIGGFEGFDAIGDFIEDEFPEEGEEFLERRWMEEQAELEMGLEEDDEALGDAEGVTKKESAGVSPSIAPQDAGPSSCPICGGMTMDMTEEVSFSRSKSRPI